MAIGSLEKASNDSANREREQEKKSVNMSEGVSIHPFSSFWQDWEFIKSNSR